MKFDTRGMQASGMTTSQINDAIRQQEANMPKVIQDFKSQVNPQNVVAAPVKTPVKQPVKTQPIKLPVIRPQMPQKNVRPVGRAVMKEGGEAKKYTKGGKINLGACGISTGGKSNKCAGW